MSGNDEMVIRRGDFSLSETQQAVHETYAAFLQRYCSVDVVRAAEPFGFDEKLWTQLSDMRPVAMGVAENAGGDGAGLSELVIAAELMGQHLAPVPFVDTAVAARLLAHDPSGPGEEWLAHAVDGSRIVTFAVADPALADRHLVPSGAIADAVVGLDRDELVLVSDPVRKPHVDNQGRAPLAWWSLDGPSRIVLAKGGTARERFAEARREWKLLTAAALAGMIEGALRLGCDQARDRVAFGVPIGFFQGVSYRLVDDYIALAGLRRLVRKAAWFADNEPSCAPRLISMAYVYGSESAMTAATNAVHVLGGVGFTVEGDAQLYFRRVKGTALLGGDPHAELLTLAAIEYGN